MANYNAFLSKTNWTLVLTVVVTAVQAVVPFMSPSAQATVTTILLLIAGIFHVNGVNKAAVASAAAGAPVSGQK